MHISKNSDGDNDDCGGISVFTPSRSLPHSMFNLFPPPASRPPLRSCNGHAPLIIQEGRARAGQYVQLRRGGRSSDLDSSIAQGKGGGGGRGSQSGSQSHSQALLFLHDFHGLSFCS
jgi:hypothetical protein